MPKPSDLMPKLKVKLGTNESRQRSWLADRVLMRIGIGGLSVLRVVFRLNIEQTVQEVIVTSIR